jgi:hypothetical protein
MIRKGCGAPVPYTPFKMSKSGRQKRKRITSGKPMRAEAKADQKMPRAAVTLAFWVSSEMCPDASKPTKIPAVT